MDLVADVLQQANANKVKVATAKLAGSASMMAAKLPPTHSQRPVAALNFKHVQTVVSAEFKKDQARIAGENSGGVPSPSKPLDTQKKEAMRGLEAVLATKMVEAMMPDDQSGLYGEGTAGEIWRGFHIDTMGKAMASQGLFSSSANAVTGNSGGSRGTGRNKLIVPFAG